MTTQATFNAAQYEVLNVLSCLTAKEDVIELKNVLTRFLNTRLQAELDRLYDIGVLSDEKMNNLAQQHLRTPYK